MIDDGSLSRLVSDHGPRALYLAVFNSALNCLVVLGVADVDSIQLATLNIFMGNLSILIAYLTRHMATESPPAPDAEHDAPEHQG